MNTWQGAAGKIKRQNARDVEEMARGKTRYCVRQDYLGKKQQAGQGVEAERICSFQDLCKVRQGNGKRGKARQEIKATRGQSSQKSINSKD